MKRNDWKIILASSAFTYLFYQQQIGVNFLLFSILICILLAINNLQNITKPSVIVSLIGTLLSSIFIFIYGTSLPIVSFIISLSLYSTFIFEPNSSLIISSLQGFLNILIAIPAGILALFNKSNKKQESSKKITKFFLLLLPLLITLVFFFLYRAANPDFFKLTKDLNFDWLSLPLFRFFIFGIILSYGILSKYFFDYFIKKDLAQTDAISSTTMESHLQGFIGKRLNIEYEVFIGASLLIMLNVLLAVVNGTDLVKLWPNPVLPEELKSYSEYLHNGIETLILSIILAISIILFFFRGYFNYLKEAKWLRILSYIWIIQNILLVCSTILRSMMYVQAYGLSHKRIGVFIYLCLAIIGLIVTFVKLLAKKNNYFLFRKNAWAFYFMLLAATPIQWDNIITDYNIHLASTQNKEVDIAYLCRLSHQNLPTLLSYYSGSKKEVQAFNGTTYNDNYLLNKKIIQFLDRAKNSNWQSYNVSVNRTFQIIQKMHQEGKLNYLILDEYEIQLDALLCLPELKGIKISKYNDMGDWHYLSEFKSLEILNLSNNSLNIISSLPILENIRELNFANNYIYDVSHLADFENLEVLHLENNPLYDFESLYGLKQLKSLYIDGMSPDKNEALSNQLTETCIYFSESKVAYR